MENRHMKPMSVRQTMLFTLVPAIIVYSAQWFIAPIITTASHQPFLFSYLICWGTTELLFLIASLVAYKAERNYSKWKYFVQRYRLSNFRRRYIVWSVVVLALMLITNQALAFSAKWLASIPSFSPSQYFPPELTPNALTSIVPGIFMGMRLKGAWWVLVVYLFGWIFNILGEELWYRGFMLPRQELTHARLGWFVNGLSFWLLHVVWKWNLLALLPGSLILSYVSQRQKTTWIGIIAHGVLNFIPIITITLGVLGWGAV